MNEWMVRRVRGRIIFLTTAFVGGVFIYPPSHLSSVDPFARLGI